MLKCTSPPEEFRSWDLFSWIVLGCATAFFHLWQILGILCITCFKSRTLADRTGTESSHSFMYCKTVSKSQNLHIYSPLLGNVVQQKWPPHITTGERECPEDSQKTFWGNLGKYVQKIRLDISKALFWAQAEGESREMGKAALRFMTSFRIMFSYAPEDIGPARDSQNHFPEELPISLLKDFYLPLSVTLQWAMREDEHIAL